MNMKQETVCGGQLVYNSDSQHMQGHLLLYPMPFK